MDNQNNVDKHVSNKILWMLLQEMFSKDSFTSMLTFYKLVAPSNK